MREVALNAEAHYHEQEAVAIFHETNVTDLDEQFAEMAFAGAFAIRMMSNLGVNETTDAMAHQLQLIAQLIVDSPDDVLKPKPQLMQYPGTAGRKRFISKLQIIAAGHAARLLRARIRMARHGHGILRSCDGSIVLSLLCESEAGGFRVSFCPSKYRADVWTITSSATNPTVKPRTTANGARRGFNTSLSAKVVWMNG